MYLMMLAGSPTQEIEAALVNLDLRFATKIQSLNTTSQIIIREANPISTVLAARSIPGGTQKKQTNVTTG